MAWQKTFSLSKKAKGCHLVTDEILAQILPGLQGVQASFSSFVTETTIGSYSGLTWNATYYLGWHALPFHVSPTPVPPPDISMMFFSQHTSAALTVNENYDKGSTSPHMIQLVV